jgi:hypothetical protein
MMGTTTTASVTPLPVKAGDNTAASRQRSRRAKRTGQCAKPAAQSVVNVADESASEIKADVTVMPMDMADVTVPRTSLRRAQ